MTGEQSKFFYLPPMTNLTAAAQAVLDAYGSSPLLNDHVLDHRHCLATAIRAVADQVVPETITPWNSTLFLIRSTPEVRAKLLNIADELEAQ
jgi:hypothetical protein